VLLVFGIIGALGYIIWKMNKNDKEKSYSAYGEEAGGLNSDGLMGLPDPDTQQYGKYNINRDDSVDSEHVLPGVGPKYGINA